MDGTRDLLFLRIGFDLIHSRHGRRKTKDEQSDFPFSTWLFHRRAPPEHQGCAAAVQCLCGAAAPALLPARRSLSYRSLPRNTFVCVTGSLLTVAAVPPAPSRRQLHRAVRGAVGSCSRGAASARGCPCPAVQRWGPCPFGGSGAAQHRAVTCAEREASCVSSESLANSLIFPRASICLSNTAIRCLTEQFAE